MNTPSHLDLLLRRFLPPLLAGAVLLCSWSLAVGAGEGVTVEAYGA